MTKKKKQEKSTKVCVIILLFLGQRGKETDFKSHKLPSDWLLFILRLLLLVFFQEVGTTKITRVRFSSASREMGL